MKKVQRIICLFLLFFSSTSICVADPPYFTNQNIICKTFRVETELDAYYLPPAIVQQCISDSIKDWENTGLVKLIYRSFGPCDIHIRFIDLEEKHFGQWDGYYISINKYVKIYHSIDKVNYITEIKSWTPQLLRSVILHEIGHAIGLEHTFSEKDLMYPFLDEENKYVKYIGPNDINQLKDIIKKRRKRFSILL